MKYLLPRKEPPRGEQVRSAIQEEVMSPGATIRIHTITKVEQLFLICEKCGTQVSQGQYKSNGLNTEDPSKTEWWYEYTCPSCGHIHKSTMNYPCQRFHFDKGSFTTGQDEGQIL